MALKHVNAVIVGAGAGGGVVAKELATAGLSVVLLERGKWYSAADCRKDDLRNQRTTVLGQRLRPRRRAQSARAGGRARARAHRRPQRRRLQQQRGLRGRRHVQLRRAWPGATWRRISACAPPMARWPAARSKTGPSPTTIWSLTTRRPNGKWASRATIPNNIFKAPRRKPLPMPPLPPNKEYQILHRPPQRLGLHPFDIPMLRNSVPYNGRRSCMRCRWCVGFACEVNARTRHAQHRDPRGAGHRQLRAAHRVHDQRDPAGRRRPRHAASPISMPTTACSSRPPTW